MRLPRLALIVLAALSSFVPVSAAPALPNSDVRLEWHAAGGATGADLPLVEYGGLRLPMRLVALRVADGTAVAPRVQQLRSDRFDGALRPAERRIPQTIDGAGRCALAEQPASALPPSPAFVLRESRIRGERVVVVALSPFFVQGGERRAATSIAVTIPGASLFESGAPAANTGPFLDAAPGPSNPSASLPGVKLLVSHAGVQRVSGAALAQAGFGDASTSGLRLRLRGIELPLELLDGGDGRLGASDELRFYAAAPGDRWNLTETYWLTNEPGGAAPLRIGTRTLASGSGEASTVALERGTWRAPRVYDSTLPGPDGDHWFAADLKTGTDQPEMSFTATITPGLPLAPGPVKLTLDGAAYTSGQHSLRVSMGGATATATWKGLGNWSHALTLAQNDATLQVAAVPGAATADGFEPDTITWERPVALRFGGRGSTFTGLPQTQRYRLQETPGRELYDITSPSAPARLALPADLTFQDSASRSYLLLGEGTQFAPEIQAYTPTNLASPLDAQAVYIAPAEFAAALGPLVELRQSQGYRATVVAPQAIYDAWSYGQVSPDAIRAFLRYAATAWAVSPLAVTLVGDGTSDPFDWSRQNRGGNMVNFIPPYMAMVDPWLKETACDTCYGQLDGDNPLDDALPDVAIGRLPVKNASELAQVVAKLVRYETAPIDRTAASQVAYVADNYREADGTFDGAGNFADYANRSIALQPAGMQIDRLFYDPTASGDPAREPDARRAYERVRALLSRGAGLVNYIGHAGQFQWAANLYQPDPSQPAETLPLLSLYDPDGLRNASWYSIVLELTCLTSAFQQPSFSGTSIDERMLLKPDGGAVATWGSSGKGVAHGHDALQRGFYRTLWQAPTNARLGDLTRAGYVELWSTGPDAQDALRTFLLLGDPLTGARVGPALHAYLPLTSR